MNDSNIKGICKCGKSTFRTISFGIAEMYVCNKCTQEMAEYLMRIVDMDKQSADDNAKEI